MTNVLAMMMLLLQTVHGRAPRANVEEIASAISAATHDPDERAALVYIAWIESRFGRYGDLHYGVMRCRRQAGGCAVVEETRRALRGLRTAARTCRTRAWVERLSHYHNGRVSRGGVCVIDSYGLRGARYVGQLLAER